MASGIKALLSGMAVFDMLRDAAAYKGATSLE